MKRALALAAIAAALAAAPAQAVVDSDEHSYLYAQFANGTDCLRLTALQTVRPDAGTNGLDIDQDIAVDVRLYQANNGACSGTSLYWRADLEENEGAVVSIDVIGGVASALARIEHPTQGPLTLAVTFVADAAPPGFTPVLNTGPPVYAAETINRDGTAYGSFSSMTFSGSGLTSADASVYVSHSLRLG